MKGKDGELDIVQGAVEEGSGGEGWGGGGGGGGRERDGVGGQWRREVKGKDGELDGAGGSGGGKWWGEGKDRRRERKERDSVGAVEEGSEVKDGGGGGVRLGGGEIGRGVSLGEGGEIGRWVEGGNLHPILHSPRIGRGIEIAKRVLELDALHMVWVLHRLWILPHRGPEGPFWGTRRE